MKNQMSGSLTFDISSLTSALLAELRPLLAAHPAHPAHCAHCAPPAHPPLADAEAVRVLMHLGFAEPEAVRLVSELNALDVRLALTPPAPTGAHRADETANTYPGWGQEA